MPTEALANNPQTSLSAAITSGATSITVASATGFPTTGQFRILIDSELMLVTTGPPSTTWTVTRQIESTTAATHTLNAVVSHPLTAGALANLNAGFWPSMSVAGLTGALAASRIVGATTSGAPASGTFAIGDSITDQSGGFRVCIAAGTPGTWAPVPNPFMFGVGGSISGSPPALPGGRYLVQAASAVGSTDGNGDLAITFPATFTTGLLVILVCMGDLAGSLHSQVNNASVTSAAFKSRIFNSTNGAAAISSGPYRVNWLAVGY